MKKFIKDFRNNQFFQLLRNNLPEKEEPDLKNGSKFNRLFRRLPEEDVDFATDIRATILSQTPQGGRLIIWATLILLVIFLIWASFSELEEVTRGEGKVVPSSHIQVIQNLEGGIISEILVNVGDTVKKDQLLLRMDETR
ncbi:hypothetical protein DS62_08385, partial [Smithella sp. SC_K08D17]